MIDGGRMMQYMTSYTNCIHMQMARWAGGVNYLMDDLGASMVMELTEDLHLKVSQIP